MEILHLKFPFDQAGFFDLYILAGIYRRQNQPHQQHKIPQVKNGREV
ncbi:MAG: hypothetical protein LBT09_09735 [Planctomycetaceae bacterium]|nr:hypothetical protein [Planctomycetaceae bacterium]